MWHDAVSSSDIVRNGSTWTHTALGYNKDEGGTEELKVYINGVIEGTSDSSDFIAVSSSNLYIGCDHDGEQYPFGGVIDEMRISFTGAELLLANNERSWQLADEYVATFQIDYYDTGYNRLIPPIGTDTQLERNLYVYETLSYSEGGDVPYTGTYTVALSNRGKDDIKVTSIGTVNNSVRKVMVRVAR